MGNVNTCQEENTIPVVFVDHPFSDKELKRLWRRFKQLDHNDIGSISIDDLLSIYELSLNPLIYRFFTIFCGISPMDVDMLDVSINFQNFVKILGIFHPKTSIETKKKFLFRIFDIDENGTITSSDLFYCLKMMIGENISDLNLKDLVSIIFSEAVGLSVGAITFEQFSALIDEREIIDLLTFKF